MQEISRLNNKTAARAAVEASLLLADPELPTVCARIIAGYTPNSPTGIWPQVRQFTIDCTVAMKPRTPSNARRLMTMIALFTVWIVTVTGCPVTPQRVFTQSNLDRFLRTRLGGHSVAYRFDVSRNLTKAARIIAGATLRQLPTPTQGDAVAPHTSRERATFVSWANTLSTPHKRQNAQTLLGLAGGAGLTAQQIMDAKVTDIEIDGDRAFVTIHEPQRRRIPVRRPWVKILANGIGTRTSGDAFRAYRLEEYPPNQLQQFLTRNRGELRPSVARLRSGWLVELIDANLPLDVLLAITGFTTLASLRPYLRYAQRHDATDWSAVIAGEVSA